VEKRRRLEALWEKSGESIGCDEVPGLDHEVKVMVEGLRQVREMIKETKDRIEELCKRYPEYPFLLTIPGFGPDVSAKVLGAIGDPDRFENGKQVLKQAGLDLSANRSGKNSAQAIPQISKQGKADLRYALYQAAFIASTKNRGFMRYYTSKVQGRQKEKGIHTKMLVKLSAKLLVIAWTLMKKKEAFNPAYLNAE
jgi:transposase